MGVRILLACGGTGGHVFPAIAAGRSLRDAHGATIAMAGRQDGIEERIAAREGVEFLAVPAVPLARGSIRRNLSMPFALLGAFRSARSVVAAFRPDAVLATGGYVSLPTGLAAASLGVPLFLQEQNAAPGVANRILGRFSRLVFAGSPAASRVFDARRVVVSGNPTRPLDARSRGRCREELGLPADGRVLLVLGGSQGALGINRILSEEHPALIAAGWTVVWQTGPREHETLAARFGGVAGLRVSAFIDDVYAAMGAADLAISRSGASTIAELALHGLPALFIPFPFATGNHQEANARELEATGAASVLLESDYRPGDALRLVEDLAGRGEAPRAAMRAFSRPGAASDIAERILQEIGGPK